MIECDTVSSLGLGIDLCIQYVVLCPYCDGAHYAEKCPRVKEIEYHPSGAIKRVRLRAESPDVTYGFPKTTAG